MQIESNTGVQNGTHTKKEEEDEEIPPKLTKKTFKKILVTKNGDEDSATDTSINHDTEEPSTPNIKPESGSSSSMKKKVRFSMTNTSQEFTETEPIQIPSKDTLSLRPSFPILKKTPPGTPLYVDLTPPVRTSNRKKKVKKLTL